MLKNQKQRGKFVTWLMGTKLFWRVYFWWGIRQARKRRLENEARMAAMPKLTHDEYWEKVAAEREAQRQAEKEANG
jgi:hypothetical protein